MIKAKLESIRRLLKIQGIVSDVIPTSENLSLEFLNVSFGPDPQGRELNMQISISDQDLSKNDEALGIKDKGTEYHLIRFFMPMPFQIKEETMGEVSRLLLFLNNSLELPGLELFEPYKSINYRYVLLSRGSTIDKRIVLSLVGMIMMFVETLSGTLEEVGSGKLTFTEVIEWAQERPGEGGE
ncbi:MAG: hypothetical protein ACI9S8_003020 [Chlamydiales bacterium]|jgi:hypothetical protein